MLEALRRYGMLSPGDRVAVGCSGGADSLCLLSLLYEAREELGISVCAVHVNHGIRGAEADRDERFVRAFCEARNIPLSVHRADVPALAAETGESTELCARRVRYACFEKEAADKIATAHTASDAAETMLINLARGSGLAGLCGIPPVRGRIIRPLIGCFREETEAYCADRGLRFMTDATNETDAYVRNRLRHRAVPALKESFPAFENNALRCAALLREDEAFLASVAEARYKEALAGARALDCGRLKDLHTAIRRRVLRRFLSDRGAGEAEARHVLLLEAHLSDARFSVTLPGGQTAAIADGTLTVSARTPEPQAAPPETVAIEKEKGGVFRFGAYTLALVCEEGAKESEKERINSFPVDFSKIDAIIKLRIRQPGDRITLEKRGCSKSLKKLMNEKKIPPEARDRMPVLADSRGVIFTPCGGADASRLPDGNTERILRILVSGPDEIQKK